VVASVTSGMEIGDTGFKAANPLHSQSERDMGIANDFEMWGPGLHQT
jgi:hypothetical protein